MSRFNAEAVCYNFERMFDQNEAGQVAGEYWGYVMGAFANDADNSLYKGCEATDEFEAVDLHQRSHVGLPDHAHAGVALDAVAQGAGGG